MYVIDSFTVDKPHGKSPWKNRFLSLLLFVPLDQIPRIKICHMVTSEHTEVIEGMRWLIVTYVLDSEDASEDGFIDNYGAASDEEDDIGSGEAGVRTGVTQSGTE